ncbi:MAG: DUF6515 family protein [Pseudomonadota bacterium]
MKRNTGSAIVLLMLTGLIALPASADDFRSERDRDNDKRGKSERKVERDRDNGDRGRSERKIERNRDDRGNSARIVERDRRDAGRDWRGVTERRQYTERERHEYEKRGFRYDTRYGHNRYYPPAGYVDPRLPKSHRVVPYRGRDYYYSSGIWYQRAGVSFSVVIPPFGIVVPVLPPDYTTVWVGADPYYYAGGVYYAWRPGMSGYQVVEAPQDKKVYAEPDVPAELFIYPKQGQSEAQQSSDRYECHRWGVDQTGYDPTQPGGNVAPEQQANKFEDYQRAMKACFEGRGYSVQ